MSDVSGAPDTEPTVAGGYTDDHAAAGLDAELPALDVFPNQFPSYVIQVDHPEFTSICPKTDLPDFGTITIEYEPAESCLELKALKLYLNGYRNLGIFQENVVNRVLRDVVEAAEPMWCEVRGEFAARGGMTTTVTAGWRRSELDIDDLDES
ncbi:MAG: NADPH-dependent 7-cyano-7-deazaguanine reductase QueF [Acidobacteria bacterium]|nr:NADPH-dependent 7-cyano-7-deazaguanine reductase QueF [Acidobacteriota bacterium]